MGLTTQQIFTKARRTLGVDENDDGFSDDDMFILGNQSYWELLDRLNFRENELTIPFDAVAESRKYGLPGDLSAFRGASVMDLNGASSKLERMTEAYYDTVYKDPGDTSEQAIPTRYYREKNFIVLWPTPDQVYTCQLHYWKTLADLADLDEVLPLPESWHEIVLLGIVWRGYLELGDLSRSGQTQNVTYALIANAVPTEAKEEIDSRLAHVEVPGRDVTYG